MIPEYVLTVLEKLNNEEFGYDVLRCNSDPSQMENLNDGTERQNKKMCVLPKILYNKICELNRGIPQDKIDSTHKLSSDLVDDTNKTHKFVTATEKSTWNGKQDFISDLDTIRTNAQKGASAIQMSDVITIEGTDYTVGQILSAIGEFMNKTIVVNG